MDKFISELERFRKLLRIRHGLIAPELIFGNTQVVTKGLKQHLSPYSRLLIVADQNSHQAAGALLKGVLPETVKIFYQIFEANTMPTMDNVHHILQVVDEVQADAICAIGSGSISDLCKLSAHEKALPLYLVATAPSMNGYTSITASIIENGLKQSFHTFLAKAIFVDEDVIAKAPERMKNAGRVDALASKSAMLDWKCSHLLLDTAYEEVLEQTPLNTDCLIETLLLQGYSMTYAGVSSPASGAEHMLAHIVEMMEPELCDGVLHGEMIAHALPLCAAHQAKLLASEAPPTLAPLGKSEVLEKHFGVHWQTIAPAFNIKQLALEATRESVNARLQSNWQAWRQELQKFLISENELEIISETPSNPSLSEACKNWLPYAHFTRNRFTSLDLV